MNLQVLFPVVVWEEPHRPNGVILSYQLIFTRNGETIIVSTDGDQTFFVITSDTLPGSSSTFIVEVCG